MKNTYRIMIFMCIGVGAYASLVMECFDMGAMAWAMAAYFAVEREASHD